tara:strand:+ start:22 stop:537 length:516 start_codon:yes stop_codon:yes gene_type:complete
MYRIIYISVILTLLGCSLELPEPLEHKFILDVGLPIDSSGYYHLELSADWQTLHRISGTVSTVSQSYNLATVNWKSSHYWYVGDTLGYIVHFNNPENDIYLYSNRDTAYVYWFNGFEVPTINSNTYQTENGEVNTMFGPVSTMKEDTVKIIASVNFADGYTSNETIEIILE